MIYSHSMLSTFSNCPRMFENDYITKKYKKEWTTTAATEQGKQRHKMFENTINLGVDLPPALANGYLGEVLKRVEQVQTKFKTKMISEESLGIDVHFNPTDFGDKQRAWFRGRLDLSAVSKDGLIGYIGDLKNGKSRWCTPEQLDRCAVLMFNNNLSLKKIIAEYHFITEEHKKTFVYYHDKKTMDKDRSKFPKKTVTDISDMLKYDISVIEVCRGKKMFNPTKNGLCKAHCPVTSCEFNGAYTG